MPRFATLVLTLAASVGLMAQEGYPTNYDKMSKQPAPKVEKGKTTPVEVPAFDVHHVQPDEFLILEEGFEGGSGWKYALLAKMLTPATKETKGEAEFFIVAGNKKGEKIWTKHYAKTRPATKDDLKLGAVLYSVDGDTDADGIYQAPANRERLLECAWFIGTVTDVSTLYKGFLSLSGYKVGPKALRIAVK